MKRLKRHNTTIILLLLLVIGCTRPYLKDNCINSAFNLSVKWDAIEITNQSIEGQIIPFEGEPIDLKVTQEGTSNWSVVYNLEEGAYGLVLKLLKNGKLWKGIVDTFNISSRATTLKLFDFSQANEKSAPPGNEDNKIQVNIVPELNSVIDVTILGGKRQMDIDETMFIESCVAGDFGNVIVVWYINGLSKDISSGYTIDDYQEGIYRVDVTVFSVDGKYAGSTNHKLNVIDYISDVSYPPLFDPIQNQVVNEGQLLQFKVDAIDVNGDELIFSALNLPEEAIFNPLTNIFSWLPDFTMAGEYEVRFEVSDGQLFDTEDIKISVQNQVPSVEVVTIEYAGDLVVKYPEPLSLKALVKQVGNISIGDLSLIKVEFELNRINADGSINPAGSLLAQCDANGIAQASLNLTTGVYSITSRILFENTYLPAEALVIVPVYNPDGSFAAGGGIIEVAQSEEGNLGKANFGFMAKYKNEEASGTLEFQYKDGDINLKSRQINWLVISATSAQFEGYGVINNTSNIFTFRVNCTDNERKGVPDKFTIKIWEGFNTELDPIYKAIDQKLIEGNIIVKNK